MDPKFLPKALKRGIAPVMYVEADAGQAYWGRHLEAWGTSARTTRNTWDAKSLYHN